MIPLNYHHLYYFRVIAKEGSISKACQVLYLAQPTLSAQLKQLEKSLGVTLFDRVNRRLELTPEGRFVLDYAESIFEMGQELKDALQDKSVRGKVNVQVGVVHGTPRAFAHALMECLLRYPDIGQVRLKDDAPGALLDALRAHQIDGLLTDRPIPGRVEDYENHLIARVPVVFAGSPAWKKKIRRIPEGLDGAPVILPSAPSQVHEDVTARLSAWKVRPRVISEVQDLEVVRRMMLAGHGISPINAYSLSVSAPKGRLVEIPISGSWDVQESVYLVTRQRRWQNPAIGYLLKHFKFS